MCSPYLRTAAVCLACILSTATQAGDLRVCADPNNLPFSKQDGSGFENKIAQVLAQQLGAQVRYTWFSQRRGFLRNTLNAGVCDVVMGYAANVPMLRSTKPYYRSSYVFVRRVGDTTIGTFDDQALRKLKIGVQLVGDDGANTPPIHDLAKRGIVGNVHGYMVYGDERSQTPLSPIITALVSGDIDVAIVWGPVAGYLAKGSKTPLTLTPILFDAASLDLPMTFDIAAGVRKSDTRLAADLNSAISARRGEIDAILSDYGVPRTDVPTSAGVTP